MVRIPDTLYATGPTGKIAYQVIGDGPIDLVIVPGWFSHIDKLWEYAEWRSFIEAFASFARVVVYDKSGTGLSDPVDGVPTVENRADDLRAVMDAAGCGRTALFGFSEGGLVSTLFAASFPDRVSALVLYGTAAGGHIGDLDVAAVTRASELVAMLRSTVDHWGEGLTLDWAVPSQKDNVEARRRMGALERAAMSPKMALITWQAVVRQLDMADIYANVRVPTLVLHRTHDAIPVELGRALAGRISGARFVELDGIDHVPWFGDYKSVTGEVEEFLTGQRHEHPPDRVLATVLFTDIVDSTHYAAELGDHGWRELLQRHDDLAQAEIASFRGTFLKHTGDGLLATFDGPTRAVLCATKLAQRMPQVGLNIRGGLHTGECIRRGDDIGGIAVHIAARIAAKAGAREVLVSNTVKDLVYGSGITFEERGAHVLKGVPGEWQLHAPTGYHDPMQDALASAGAW
ncbi:adenylate/guanylate cyclase domain-containing protein [Mycolicibacterium agri]|uniref:Adenylate/guanylate cyclase domain-containing protein n=1 Tax=Mycolicibacterium agri TaxID=36811 RepID=A0A2A7MQR1_MYCAG|nr:adenylate/guanylate cyclase domain-containing protein [Mycolicibacterium agri]PEG34036.1 adenylate/guanylate cyclase domain-containing protein [Mycolicibacterium agri]GFG48987.1 hydrolase [Mycolicibacterium agri]